MKYNKKEYSRIILDAINEVDAYNCEQPTDKKEKDEFLDYLLVRYVNAQNELNHILNSSLIKIESRKRKKVNDSYFNLNKKDITSLNFDAFKCDVWARLNSYSFHLKRQGERNSKPFEAWAI